MAARLPTVEERRPTYLPIRERLAVAARLLERHDHPPTSVVIIATTPRTGSTLLGRTLGATGVVGRPEEHLLPVIMANRARRWGVPRVAADHALEHRRNGGRRAWYDYLYFPFTARSTRNYLLMAARREQTANGVFALKVHQSSFHLAMERNGITPDLWGVPVTWLRTRRRDRLAQAVSLVRADQTKQFIHHMQARGEARYDHDAIVVAMARIDAQERAWDAYFATHRIDPFLVVHEDLAADHEGTVASVLEHLGHVGVAVPPPPIERQGDHLNIEWMERFRRETGSA